MARKIEKKVTTQSIAEMKKNKRVKVKYLPAGQHSTTIGNVSLTEKIIEQNVSKQRPEMKVVELSILFIDSNGYGHVESKSVFDYDFRAKELVSIEQWDNRFNTLIYPFLNIIPDDLVLTSDEIVKYFDELKQNKTPIFLEISPNIDPFSGKITRYVDIDFLDE